MNKIKLELNNNLGSVENIATYGSDVIFYQVAGVCTGNGFWRHPKSSENLASFIYSLMKNKHLRCFEFAGILFGIRCPIFVERQLRTYRKPDIERSLRLCEPIELSENYPIPDDNVISCSKLEALKTYQELRDKKVKREEARRVLPLDVATEVISLYSIRSLLHVFDERLAKSAQSETTQFVEQMYTITKQAFPLTIQAYERIKEEENKK